MCGLGLRSLEFFIPILRRFTSFRTIGLYFSTMGNNLAPFLDYVRTTLEPRLGYANDSDRLGVRDCEFGQCYADNCECDGVNYSTRADLRFHPTNHRDGEKEPEKGHLADSLDELYEEWHRQCTSIHMRVLYLVGTEH